MTPDQLQMLIAAIQMGGGGGAAGAAVMVGSMGPCASGKDKLKRPKRLVDWHKDALNKMRFSGITDSVQKLNFLRSCAGAKLTELGELVSKDRAIIDLLRMEQGGRGFIDFIADMEDQMHLCHSWEELTSKDMKRISLLGGLKDRTLAEKALA